MIKEAYCSLEVSRLLKEKGFDEPTRFVWYEKLPASIGCDDSKIGKTCMELFYYNSTTQFEQPFTNDKKIPDYIQGDVYSAPTHQTALTWLREEKNIDIDIHTDCGMLGYKRYTPCIQTYKPMPKPKLLSAEDEWNDRWIQKTTYLRYENDKGLIPACKYFFSYEEAVEEALLYVLKNLI